MLNKKLIMIVTMLLVLVTPIIALDSHYYVSFTQDLEGEMDLDDLDVIEGGTGLLDLGFETHKVELKDFNENVLYNFTMFVEEPVTHYDNFGLDDVPPDMPDYSVESFTIPMFRNGKEIRIFNLETREVLTIDVSHYATCNLDFICDLQEDERSCPEDCVIKKLESKEEVEEKLELSEKKEDEKKKVKGSNTIFITIIIVLAILVVIIGLLVSRKRKVYK
jgi:hypothetical protein